MMTTCKKTLRTQAGYNLVEVLLAMAMLGVVTISIFTLFFMGRRNVYSGKQTSQAIAIATEVIEDLQPLNRQMLYGGAFNLGATSTGTAFTIPPVQTGALTYAYTNSAIRSTDTAFIATPPTDIATENAPPGLLAKWAGLLGNKLTKGSVTIVMTPDRDPTNAPPQFATAQLLRVRVFVRWLESGRQREVVMDTVKAF
jgi:prepilin-type N-terminal cleavage/methylation domain-containing protein